MKIYKVGCGLINSLIDKLPFEAHLPGYQYCGPGTKLEKRLARGDPGINPLDSACKAHDIVYGKHSSDEERREADKILAAESWKRVTSWDAGVGERAAALAVSAAMKGKVAFGGGLKKKKKSATKKKIKAKKCCSFKKMVAHAKKALKKARPQNADQILSTALLAAKHVGQSQKVSKPPRIIQLPKTGGFLPLVPIFAGLSALGTLSGGAASLLRALKSTDDGRKILKRGRGGSVVIGHSRSGDGLYLKPYKSGHGLYLKPYSGSKN